MTLSKKSRWSINILGVNYSSKTEAANYYGVKVGTVIQRLAAGWTNEEAFVLGKRINAKRTRWTVKVFGIEYPNMRAAIVANGAAYKRVILRKAAGSSLEDSIKDAIEAKNQTLENIRHKNNRLERQQEFNQHLLNAPRVIDGKIYLITNTVNDKKYVGLTARPLTFRFSMHKRAALKGGGQIGGLMDAMRLHGSEAFSIELLQKCDTDTEMAAAEIEWISKLNTVYPNGYNRNKGGSLGGFADVYVLEGKTYLGLTELAEAYGVKEITMHKRMQSGRWSLEQAVGLAAPPSRLDIVGKNNKSVTVEGVTYKKINDACRRYAIDKRVFNYRIRFGWTIEEALELIERPKKKFIVANNEFDTFRQACDYYAINYKKAESRMRLGWRLEEVFGLAERITERRISRSGVSTESIKKSKAISIEGRTFNSLSNLSDFYNIKPGTLSYRLRNGWSAEQAVGLVPPPQNNAKIKSITIRGKAFRSLPEACRHFKKNVDRVQSRIRLGWTLEQALGLKERT